MTTKELRELLRVSRSEFARRYGIPLRTVENWEFGVNTPPAYVLALLERVVRQDISEGKS